MLLIEPVCHGGGQGGPRERAFRPRLRADLQPQPARFLAAERWPSTGMLFFAEGLCDGEANGRRCIFPTCFTQPNTSIFFSTRVSTPLPLGLQNILGETIENELQNKQTELLTLDRSRVLRSCAHDGNVQPEISRKSLVVTHQNAQRIQ